MSEASFWPVAHKSSVREHNEKLMRLNSAWLLCCRDRGEFDPEIVAFMAEAWLGANNSEIANECFGGKKVATGPMAKPWQTPPTQSAISGGVARSAADWDEECVAMQSASKRRCASSAKQ